MLSQIFLHDQGGWKPIKLTYNHTEFNIDAESYLPNSLTYIINSKENSSDLLNIIQFYLFLNKINLKNKKTIILFETLKDLNFFLDLQKKICITDDKGVKKEAINQLGVFFIKKNENINELNVNSIHYLKPIMLNLSTIQKVDASTFKEYQNSNHLTQYTQIIYYKQKSEIYSNGIPRFSQPLEEFIILNDTSQPNVIIFCKNIDLVPFTKNSISAIYKIYAKVQPNLTMGVSDVNKSLPSNYNWLNELFEEILSGLPKNWQKFKFALTLLSKFNQLQEYLNEKDYYPPITDNLNCLEKINSFIIGVIQAQQIINPSPKIKITPEDMGLSILDLIKNKTEAKIIVPSEFFEILKKCYEIVFFKDLFFQKISNSMTSDEINEIKNQTWFTKEINTYLPETSNDPFDEIDSHNFGPQKCNIYYLEYAKTRFIYYGQLNENYLVGDIIEKEFNNYLIAREKAKNLENEKLNKDIKIIDSFKSNLRNYLTLTPLNMISIHMHTEKPAQIKNLLQGWAEGTMCPNKASVENLKLITAVLKEKNPGLQYDYLELYKIMHNLKEQSLVESGSQTSYKVIDGPICKIVGGDLIGKVYPVS